MKEVNGSQRIWKTETIEYYDQYGREDMQARLVTNVLQSDIIAHIISPRRKMPMVPSVDYYCLTVDNRPIQTGSQT
jgi:hypothetical protein